MPISQQMTFPAHILQSRTISAKGSGSTLDTWQYDHKVGGHGYKL